MKNFLRAGVLGALLCALPLTANAAPKVAAKVPVLTRNNFVSLQFFTAFTKKQTFDTVRGLKIQQNSTTEEVDSNVKQGIPLSNNQCDELVEQINLVNA